MILCCACVVTFPPFFSLWRDWLTSYSWKVNTMGFVIGLQLQVW